MPTYEYRCSLGHVTERIVPAKDWREQIRCSTVVGCPSGTRYCLRVAKQFLSKPPHPHSGRTIWTATEVHGKKKAASETFSHDLEDACLK